MGACSLLCRRHGFKLDILLHATHHFHIPDYSVFGCRGLVLGKVELISTTPLPNATTEARRERGSPVQPGQVCEKRGRGANKLEKWSELHVRAGAGRGSRTPKGRSRADFESLFRVYAYRPLLAVEATVAPGRSTTDPKPAYM